MFLTFDHVTKFYGPVIGVNNISCRIGPGITGLFGANGAGKSTLMKLASGQLRPSQGDVRIGDHRAWSTAAKRHFGYSPDVNSFYEEMTCREFVYVMARLYGLSRAVARQRTAEVIEEVGMSDRAGRRLAGCSHGMRQRIKLAQALINDPPDPAAGRAAQRHRSRRTPRNQPLAGRAGRKREDDPGLQPHPGRDRDPDRFGVDHRPRADRRLGHAGRDSRAAGRPAADGRNRFVASAAIGRRCW